MRKKEGVEAAAAVSGGETKAQRKQREAFERVLSFAKLLRYPLWDVNDQSTKSTPRYTRYTKEDLMDYMQSPATNEANIRNASIYMFDCSSQYKRLILYYAFCSSGRIP